MVSAQQGGFAMPDPKQMSGIPRPVTDLPDGSISVRLIRGPALEQHHRSSGRAPRRAARSTTVKTDENGRAQFKDADAGRDGEGHRPTSTASTSSRRSSRRRRRAASACCSSRPTRRKRPAPRAAGAGRRRRHRRPVAHRHGAGRGVGRRLLPARHRQQRARAGESADAVRVRHAGRRVGHGDPGGIVAAGERQAARASRVQGPFPPGHTFVQVARALPAEDGTAGHHAEASGDPRAARRRRQEGRRDDADVAAAERAAGHAGRRRDLHRRRPAVRSPRASRSS